MTALVLNLSEVRQTFAYKIRFDFPFTQVAQRLAATLVVRLDAEAPLVATDEVGVVGFDFEIIHHLDTATVGDTFDYDPAIGHQANLIAAMKFVGRDPTAFPFKPDEPTSPSSAS